MRPSFLILCSIVLLTLSSCEDDFVATPKKPVVEPPTSGKLYFMEFDFFRPLDPPNIVKAYANGDKEVIASASILHGTPYKNFLLTYNVTNGFFELLDSTGGGLTGPVPAQPYHVAQFSPDYTKLVYVEEDLFTGMGTLYLQQLTNPFGIVEISSRFDLNTTPVFSPDGNSIAYYTKEIDGFGSELDGFEVHNILGPLNQAAKADIGPDMFDNTDEDLDAISWHPQSGEVLFHTMLSVYKFVPGGMTTKIGDGIHGVYSPDGSKILYSDMTLGKFDLYVVDQSGPRDQITFSSNIMEIFPQWSPDGKWVSFTELYEADPRYSNDPQKVKLKAIRIDDPQQTVLFSEKAFRGFWLPD